jgi:hypothetical protein
MSRVARHEREVMSHSGSPNEQVEIRNQIPAATQLRSSAAENLHDWIGERKRFISVQECVELFDPSIGVREIEDAFEQFAMRNNADVERGWMELVDDPCRIRAPSDDIDQPVCVEQASHC